MFYYVREMNPPCSEHLLIFLCVVNIIEKHEQHEIHIIIKVFRFQLEFNNNNMKHDLLLFLYLHFFLMHLYRKYSMCSWWSSRKKKCHGSFMLRFKAQTLEEDKKS